MMSKLPSARLREKKTKYSKAEEQEYLQFLLRITEDIIINNYSKTDDIEKVFEYHIEINKERLDMEKMITQVVDLSYALNISCDKFRSSEFSDKRVHEESAETIDYSLFKDCECSVKRILPLSIKKFPVNGTSLIETLHINTQDNLPDPKLNKIPHISDSLNSIDLTNENLKYPSETEILGAQDLDALDFTEIVEYKKQYNEVLPRKKELDEISEADSSITLIDSNHCEEKSASEFSEASHKICINTGKEEIGSKKIGEYKNGKYEDIVENTSRCTTPEKEKKLEKQLTFVKTCTTKSEKKLIEKNPSNEFLPVAMSSLEERNKNFTDKCTQILIEQKDKESDTITDNFNEIETDSTYVLINGPLYILKGALSSDRRIVLSEKKHIDIDIAPVKEVGPPQLNHINNNVIQANLNSSDYSILSQTDSGMNYLNDVTFSRLLHSDYDITPEKDDSLNKYHYLMVDAYTTISNVNIKDQQSNENILANSEKYFNTNIIEKSHSSTDYQNYVYQEDVSRDNQSCTIEKINQHLLAKSEEYLLHSDDFSVESGENNSKNLLKNIFDTKESEKNTNLPFDRTRPKMRYQSRIFSAPSNHLDTYRIREKKNKNSNSDDHNVVGLRRHRSLQ